MSYARGQTVAFDQTSGYSGAYSGAVSAGSILVMIARVSGTGGVGHCNLTAVSDSVNGAWQEAGYTADYDSGDTYTSVWIKLNSAAGTPTVSHTYGAGSHANTRWILAEYTGGSSATILASVKTAITAGGAGTWGTSSLLAHNGDLELACAASSSSTTSLAATAPLSLYNTGTKVWLADNILGALASVTPAGTIDGSGGANSTGTVALLFREGRKSLRIDASGDYARLVSNLPASSTSYTVCGWFKINADRPGQWRYLFDIGDAVTNAPHSISMGWRNTDLFEIYAFSASQTFPSNPPTDGTWIFMALVRNGTSFTGYFRLAGDASWTTVSSTYSYTYTIAAIYYGTDSYDEWCSLDMVYLRTWDTPLSAAELLSEMTSEVPVQTANLLHGSSDDGADVSGGGYDLVLNGLSTGADAPALGASANVKQAAFQFFNDDGVPV